MTNSISKMNSTSKLDRNKISFHFRHIFEKKITISFWMNGVCYCNSICNTNNNGILKSILDRVSKKEYLLHLIYIWHSNYRWLLMTCKIWCILIRLIMLLLIIYTLAAYQWVSCTYTYIKQNKLTAYIM